MAYLRSLESKCQTCRVKRATCEVIDHRNESRGEYCARCGKRKLAEVKAQEDAMVATRA